MNSLMHPDTGLARASGFVTSLCDTSNEQWDAPYAWAPLQSILVEALHLFCGEEGKKHAKDMAQRWIQCCRAGWERTGFLFEKYHADVPGSRYV